ncbi:MAG: hypothetical protein ABJA98_20685 [Acidobacteriota bacterium]
MKFRHSYREMRRAEVRTIGWFFAIMAVVTLAFAVIVAVHYLLAWW